MKKTNLIIVFVLCSLGGVGQNKIDWSERDRLALSDFKSPSTQLNPTMIMLNPAVMIEFSFAMSNAEFRFTKNFNSKVSCTFNRSASSWVAPDSALASTLVALAQFDFDLGELYARKFRRRLNAEKKFFSGASFFKPIYDQII